MGNNYVLKATPLEPDTQRAYRAVNEELRNATALWHRRLGHVGPEKLAQLSETVNGVPALDTRTLGVCDVCETTKSHRLVNRVPPPPAEDKLGRVYSDFKGPISPRTLGGARYILSFTDDYSRKAWIYLTKLHTVWLLIHRYLTDTNRY